MAIETHWPLLGLRITTPSLELRTPSDADLATLVDLVLAGIHDPHTMPFTNAWTDTESPDLERGALQYWWRCRAEMPPSDGTFHSLLFPRGRLSACRASQQTTFRHCGQQKPVRG